MATHKSAEKRHRQSLKRRDRNREAKSAIRTEIKKTLTVLNDKNKEATTDQLKKVTSVLDKAIVSKLFHKNKAARIISRLSKRANA